MQVYTNLLTVRKRSFAEIRFYKRRMDDDKTNCKMQSLGWSWIWSRSLRLSIIIQICVSSAYWTIKEEISTIFIIILQLLKKQLSLIELWILELFISTLFGLKKQLTFCSCKVSGVGVTVLAIIFLISCYAILSKTKIQLVMTHFAWLFIQRRLLRPEIDSKKNKGYLHISK